MDDSWHTIDSKDFNYDYRMGRLAAIIRVAADTNSETDEERVDSLIQALAIEFHEQYGILTAPQELIEDFLDSVRERILDTFSQPQHLLYEGYNGYLYSHGIEIISHPLPSRPVCIEDFGGDSDGE